MTSDTTRTTVDAPAPTFVTTTTRTFTTTRTYTTTTVVEAVDLVSDLETWLADRTEAAAGRRIRWQASAEAGRVETVVRDRDHLVVLVSHLRAAGDYGVVEITDHDGRWGQTMQHPGGWIVEVHDGTDTDFRAAGLPR